MSNYDEYYNSTGTHWISNSGCDENGGIIGGQAGDQGGEWTLRSWYSRPWNCVIRHPDEKVRMKIAELSCSAALNQAIGYDQGERYTYWDQLVKNGYDPSKITTPCESDCSAGVCSNVRAVGNILGIPELKGITITSTYYMRQMLRNVGFEVLTDKKYRVYSDFLLPGDILLNDDCHTAVNITRGKCATGSSSSASGTTSKKTDTHTQQVSSSAGTSMQVNKSGKLNTTKKWTGIVTDDDPFGLNVRTWAGIEYATCSFSPLFLDEEIAVCDAIYSVIGEIWYYIYIQKGETKLYGFVHSGYVKMK